MNEVMASVFFLLAAASAAVVVLPLLLCGVLDFVWLVSPEPHERKGLEV